MNALKAAVWISKLEDRRDALRLRLHTMGIKALFNQDEQESIKPQRLSLETLPAYLKEKALSGLIFFASIPILFVSLLRPKSFLGGLLLVIVSLVGVALLLVALISGSLYYYLSQPVDEQQRQRYLSQHQQLTAFTLHDANNDLIGAFPPVDNQRSDSRGALFVPTVPAIFWDLIKAPADHALNFTQPQTDFWTLYKKIIQFQDAFYKGINLAAPYQTNTQHSLLHYIAHGLQPTENTKLKQQGFITGLLNTKKTLHLARHLYPYLAQNEGKEFKRWSAMHAPLLSAKNDVYGLSAIAATLFGKKATRLNAGQQAILATAYHRQTAMALLFSSDTKIRQTTWEQLIKQTEQSVSQHYKNIQPQTRQRILAALKRMRSVPSLSMSSSWLQFLNSRPQSEQQYRHLLQRSTLTLGKLKPNLYQAVQDIPLKQTQQTTLIDVRLSLSILQNQQFNHALDTAFGIIQRFYPTLFNKQLGQESDKNGALIRLRVANEQGNIIRWYQRGNMTPRPIANLSDIAISSLLLAHHDGPKTRYCNKTHMGMRNASDPKREGISTCKALKQKGHAFSLQDSIQYGKTLPLFYALRQKHAFSAATLSALYDDFGFLQDSTPENMPRTSTLAYELSIGDVKSTPEKMHQVVHALTRELYGIPYRQDPSIIQSLRINRLSESGETPFTQRGITQNAKNFQRYFSTTSRRRYMRTLFALPSYKKQNPLQFLHSVEKKYGVDFLIVKSATSKTSNGHIRDKWLVGSLRIKEHIYSFVIMIGSDDKQTGLGKNISHQQLMLPIINALIESL